jgi:hypothetical protein
MNLENLNWGRLIEQNVKPVFVEVNQKALARGMELVGA